MILPSIIEIIFLLILLVNLFIGIFVYFKNRKDVINQIFLGIVISTIIWLIGLGIILKANPLFVLFGGRLTFAGASLIPLFFYCFLLSFQNKKSYRLFSSYPFVL